MKTTFLLLLLPLCLCSAAPLDIAGEDKNVDPNADHVGMHSHDEAHSAHDDHRVAKIFSKNQFDLGNINVSGSATGNDISIGHQLEINVHRHAHRIVTRHRQDGHAHGQDSHNHSLDSHAHGQDSHTHEHIGPTYKNMRALGGLKETIETIDDYLKKIANGRHGRDLKSYELDLHEIITQAITLLKECGGKGTCNAVEIEIVTNEIKSAFDEIKKIGKVSLSLRDDFVQLKEQIYAVIETAKMKVKAILEEFLPTLLCTTYKVNSAACFCMGQTYERGTPCNAGQKCNVDGTCQPGYVSLGCWKDDGSNSAIEPLEGTDTLLDYNYRERKNAVYICFTVAKSKGYRAFAVQSGGECFGCIHTAPESYKKSGVSSNCVNGKGGRLANDVYEIQACAKNAVNSEACFCKGETNEGTPCNAGEKCDEAGTCKLVFPDPEKYYIIENLNGILVSNGVVWYHAWVDCAARTRDTEGQKWTFEPIGEAYYIHNTLHPNLYLNDRYNYPFWQLNLLDGHYAKKKWRVTHVGGKKVKLTNIEENHKLCNRHGMCGTCPQELSTFEEEIIWELDEVE